MKGESGRFIYYKTGHFYLLLTGLPWVGILFIFLIMVTYIPWISTYLPTLLMGPEIIAS